MSPAVIRNCTVGIHKKINRQGFQNGGGRSNFEATQALRPLRDLVYNHIAFEEEVKASLNSLFQKHREEQSSLERVRQSQISAASLIEGEVKIWLKLK